MKIKFRIIVKNNQYFLKIDYNGPQDTIELKKHTETIKKITIPTTKAILLEDNYPTLDLYMHQQVLFSLSQIIHIYINDSTMNKIMFEEMVMGLKERLGVKHGS